MNNTQLTWPVSVTVAVGRAGDADGRALDREADLVGAALLGATVTVTVLRAGGGETRVACTGDGCDGRDVRDRELAVDATDLITDGVAEDEMGAASGAEVADWIVAGGAGAAE